MACKCNGQFPVSSAPMRRVSTMLIHASTEPRMVNLNSGEPLISACFPRRTLFLAMASDRQATVIIIPSHSSSLLEYELRPGPDSHIHMHTDHPVIGVTVANSDKSFNYALAMLFDLPSWIDKGALGTFVIINVLKPASTMMCAAILPFSILNQCVRDTYQLQNDETTMCPMQPRNGRCEA